MADYKRVQIRGLEELRRTLGNLGEKLECNVCRGMVRAGCMTVRDEARRLAPKDTHEMEMAIEVRQAPLDRRRNSTEYWVFARSNRRKGAMKTKKAWKKLGIRFSGIPNAWYWHFVEFGHRIVPRGSRINRKRTNIDKVSIGFVPAKPFMRPAFDFKKRQVIVDMKKYLRARLAKEDFKRRSAG